MRPQSILLLKDKLKLNYFMRSRTGLWPGRLFKLNLLQYGHKNDNENNRTVIIFVFYPSIRYTIAKYSGLIRFVEVHMASTLKLPVGIENFEEIIRNNFYFIDAPRERKARMTPPISEGLEMVYEYGFIRTSSFLE